MKFATVIRWMMVIGSAIGTAVEAATLIKESKPKTLALDDLPDEEPDVTLVDESEVPEEIIEKAEGETSE